MQFFVFIYFIVKWVIFYLELNYEKKNSDIPATNQKDAMIIYSFHTVFCVSLWEIGIHI